MERSTVRGSVLPKNITQWPRPVVESPYHSPDQFDILKSELIFVTKKKKTTLLCKLYNASSTKRYHFWQTGETSAGKSSIINLILAEDLLPYSTLSTTSTICELKYAEKPGIKIHFKDCASESGEPIYQELGQSSRTYKEEIEPFLNVKNERDKGSPYKMIELFWPHPLFKVTSNFQQVISLLHGSLVDLFGIIVCPEFSKDNETQLSVSLC